MTVLEGGGLVLLPGESRTIRASGFRVLEYATAEVTGGLYSLIETVESEPGAGPPLHVHRNAAEAFYVIEGEYRMHLDGRDFLCAAGSFVYVPQGMAHTFVVARAGSRKLNLSRRRRWKATSTSSAPRSNRASTRMGWPRSPIVTRWTWSDRLPPDTSATVRRRKRLRPSQATATDGSSQS